MLVGTLQSPLVAGGEACRNVSTWQWEGEGGRRVLSPGVQLVGDRKQVNFIEKLSFRC